MHRRQLIEDLGLDNLKTRLEELGAQQERVEAAHNQHRKREPQVERTNVLVVGRKQPTAQAMRMIVGVISVTVVIEYCAHEEAPDWLTNWLGDYLRAAATSLG